MILEEGNSQMKRLVISDELIERIANSYRSHFGKRQSMEISFQQFLELELVRLEKAIA